jgi:hypothetical protein
MLDRNDLTFATCYQLAGEIKEDWEEGRPEIVDRALKALHMLHEPAYISDTSSNDPEESAKYMAILDMIADYFKVILANSDEWKTQKADMIKKELVSRVKEYERIIKTRSSPVLGGSGPEVHL